MTNPLLFIGVLVLAGVFSVTLAVVVLRFLSVMQQIQRSNAMDRSELMREIDASHVQAFTNAMSALGDVQGRVVDSQTAMFNKTMDMVHGPVEVAQKNDEAYAVDSPRVDMRTPWQANDDTNDLTSYIDPTDEDEWLGLAGDVRNDTGPRTVSVRPGETLVPGQ